MSTATAEKPNPDTAADEHEELFTVPDEPPAKAAYRQWLVDLIEREDLKLIDHERARNAAACLDPGTLRRLAHELEQSAAWRKRIESHGALQAIGKSWEEFVEDVARFQQRIKAVHTLDTNPNHGESREVLRRTGEPIFGRRIRDLQQQLELTGHAIGQAELAIRFCKQQRKTAAAYRAELDQLVRRGSVTLTTANEPLFIGRCRTGGGNRVELDRTDLPACEALIEKMLETADREDDCQRQIHEQNRQQAKTHYQINELREAAADWRSGRV